MNKLNLNFQLGRPSLGKRTFYLAMAWFVSILLDNRLIDFKRPVKLAVNGQVSLLQLQPSLLTLCQTLSERGDPELAFTARIEARLKPDAK